MLLPVNPASKRTFSRWKLLGCLLVIAGIVAWGADRKAADATHPLAWTENATKDVIDGPTFRVASFNIHGGKGTDRKLDLDRIADCLKKSQPDFVGLNEVHGTRFGTQQDQAVAIGSRLGMAAMFIPTEERFWQPSFGNGLLTGVKTTPVHRIPLPCTQGKKYRVASLTSFRVGEHTVRVLSVHLDRVQDREEQLNRVFSLFLDLETPAILMGDLNTFPDDPLLQKWRDGSDIQDAVHEALEDQDPERRIDWIFTRGLETVTADCVANDSSDHPLVWAELKIP